MAWIFTAAAERALAEAQGWKSRSDRDELGPPELLVGLLAEPECRAAEMLVAHGVDVSAIRGRWPTLEPASNGGAREFSPDIVAALVAAVDRLWEYPRPLTLATEHLLLGLAAAGEVSVWLAEHGLRADDLEAQIHHWYGHQPGPLALETGADAAQASPQQGASEAEALPAPETHPVDVASELPPANAGQHDAGLVSPVVPSASAQRLDVLSRLPTVKVTAAEAPLLRIIDAAANRAREGLRVVEDYVRMVLEDRHLASALKNLRHELTQALAPFANADLLAARDTLGDVGTTIATEAEFTRSNLGTVPAANWKRLQEALRTLEEYAKVTQPAAAAKLEQLRYRSYTLERAAVMGRGSVARLATVRLCVLLDGQSSEAEFVRLIDSLLAAGVGMFQLRDKKLADAELLDRARRIGERTAAGGALAIVNDRADIAVAAGADGVHIGQDDLPLRAARAIVGPQALVGCSSHSLEQARSAVFKGANYIGVGPTFPSTTKSFDAFTGLELLAATAAEIRLPSFAIGGITLDNLASVINAGFRRVAVSGAIVAAPDPAAAAAQFVSRLAAS